MSNTKYFERNGLSRRGVLRAGGLALGGALFPKLAGAQSAGASIATSELGAGLFLFQGAGCNVLALRGSDGALLIDGGLKASSDALLAAVYAATGTERIHTLINTHWHPEQTGANETVGRAGGTIFAHEKTAMYLGQPVYSALFEGRLEPLAAEGRPTKTVRAEGSFEFAGQSVDYGYLPAAHTDGDLCIALPAHDLLAVGGIVSAEAWPLIDHRNGAWLGGRVRAVERLASFVKPDTRVVPSDGRLLTGAELVRQRDIYRTLFTTMIGYMNRGFGPEDAVANNPLKEYESEFGDPSAFLEGAFRSMLIAYVPD